MSRIFSVRKFYEQEYMNRPDELITEFKYKNQIGGTGYGLYEDMTEKEYKDYEQTLYKKEIPSALRIRISKQEKIHHNILEYCDRLNWYLKHSLGELSVVKLAVESIPTFAFLIQGFVDDGWDNSCQLMEIWDNSGELIGSVAPPSLEDEQIV